MANKTPSGNSGHKYNKNIALNCINSQIWSLLILDLVDLYAKNVTSDSGTEIKGLYYHIKKTTKFTNEANLTTAFLKLQQDN